MGEVFKLVLLETFGMESIGTKNPTPTQKKVFERR
jgi:hypothetical protein